MRFMVSVLIGVVSLGAAAPGFAEDSPHELLACGDDEIRLYREADGVMEQMWKWSASDAEDLPARYRHELLAKIDECKPVEGDSAILATSSTGGVVVIRRRDGKVLFRAHAPMAHSADLLPDGRIAVALSLHEEGNRLEIYDRKLDETVLFSIPLPSGHGVVWDESRQRLFALSHDVVQAFRLDAWKTKSPKLTEVGRWQLPGKRDGHDLSLDPATKEFVVTTEDGAWRFSPDMGAFMPLPFLNPARQVKAVTFRGDRVAWVQAEESWWAYGFTVAQRDGSNPTRVEVDRLHLYKVRWLP